MVFAKIQKSEKKLPLTFLYRHYDLLHQWSLTNKFELFVRCGTLSLCISTTRFQILVTNTSLHFFD